MAETLTEFSGRTSYEATRSLSKPVRRLLGWAFLIAPTATTGLASAGIVSDTEQHYDYGDAQQAQGLTRCLEFAESMKSGTVHVKAREIPNHTQSDCCIKGGIDDVQSNAQEAIYADSKDLPDGMALKVETDPVVTLNVDGLKNAIANAKDDAESSNIGLPITAGIIGAFIGFGLSAGSFVLRDWLVKQDKLDRIVGPDLS